LNSHGRVAAISSFPPHAALKYAAEISFLLQRFESHCSVSGEHFAFQPWNWL
jgi:hypothetical protein